MVSRIHAIVPALVFLSIAAGEAPAAERYIDGTAMDWCFGAPSNRRIDNSAARLACGLCDGAFYPTACLSDSECSAGQVCSGSQEEIVWYDARTDGAVNDLRTVATAQDEFALYFIVDVHTWGDPTAMPNIQIALDFQPGGTHDLVDPHGTMVAPGVCSGSPDRACTEDEDCHFCTRSFEFPACCDEGTCEEGELCRVRICGSGCDPYDPLDLCDASQTCENLGTTERSSAAGPVRGPHWEPSSWSISSPAFRNVPRRWRSRRRYRGRLSAARTGPSRMGAAPARRQQAAAAPTSDPARRSVSRPS